MTGITAGNIRALSKLPEQTKNLKTTINKWGKEITTVSPDQKELVKTLAGQIRLVRETLKSVMEKGDISSAYREILTSEAILGEAVQLWKSIEKNVKVIKEDRNPFLKWLQKSLLANIFYKGNWVEVAKPFSWRENPAAEVHDVVRKKIGQILGESNLRYTPNEKVEEIKFLPSGKTQKETLIANLYQKIKIKTIEEGKNYLENFAVMREEISILDNAIQTYCKGSTPYHILKESESKGVWSLLGFGSSESTIVPGQPIKTGFKLRIGLNEGDITFKEGVFLAEVDGKKYSWANSEELDKRYQLKSSKVLAAEAKNKQQAEERIIKDFIGKTGIGQIYKGLPLHDKVACYLEWHSEKNNYIFVVADSKGRKEYEFDTTKEPGQIFLKSQDSNKPDIKLWPCTLDALKDVVINLIHKPSESLSKDDILLSDVSVTENLDTQAEFRQKLSIFSPGYISSQELSDAASSLGSLAKGAFTFDSINIQNNSFKIKYVDDNGKVKELPVSMVEDKFKSGVIQYSSLEALFGAELKLTKEQRIQSADLKKLIQAERALMQNVEQHSNYFPFITQDRSNSYKTLFPQNLHWYLAKGEVQKQESALSRLWGATKGAFSYIRGGFEKLPQWDYCIKKSDGTVQALELVREGSDLKVQIKGDVENKKYSNIDDLISDWSKKQNEKAAVEKPQGTLKSLSDLRTKEQELRKQLSLATPDTNYGERFGISIDKSEDKDSLIKRMNESAKKENVNIGCILFDESKHSISWIVSKPGEEAKIKPIAFTLSGQLLIGSEEPEPEEYDTFAEFLESEQNVPENLEEDLTIEREEKLEVEEKIYSLDGAKKIEEKNRDVKKKIDAIFGQYKITGALLGTFSPEAVKPLSDSLKEGQKMLAMALEDDNYVYALVEKEKPFLYRKITFVEGEIQLSEQQTDESWKKAGKPMSCEEFMSQIKGALTKDQLVEQRRHLVLEPSPKKVVEVAPPQQAGKKPAAAPSPAQVVTVMTKQTIPLGEIPSRPDWLDSTSVEVTAKRFSRDISALIDEIEQKKSFADSDQVKFLNTDERQYQAWIRGLMGWAQKPVNRVPEMQTITMSLPPLEKFWLLELSANPVVTTSNSSSTFSYLKKLLDNVSGEDKAQLDAYIKKNKEFYNDATTLKDAIAYLNTKLRT